MGEDAGKIEHLLRRVLRSVTEVRKGEAVNAVLMALTVFLILTAYYIVKPVREALILASPDGAEHKSYATAAVAVLLLAAVPAYSAFARRVPRNRLVVGVTLFFTACLVGFYFLAQSSWRPHLAIPFYLWVGVFNMMVVAQFWAFANDLYSKEQGIRLFALIGIGQSVGAAVGSKLTSFLLKPPAWMPLGTMTIEQLLLVSAGVLGCTAMLLHYLYGRLRQQAELAASFEDTATQTQAVSKEDVAQKNKGAFGLVFATPYLLSLAAFHLIFTLANTNGEYILGRLVSRAAQGAANPEAWIGEFYGSFYFYVNVGGVLLQSFAVSRIVKHAGMRIAFLNLPCLVMASSVLIAVLPVLAVIRYAKVAENATDYSLNNTVRNMLWLPTTAEMKYRAKQAVDTFFVRMGDVGSAAVVWVGTGILSIGVRGFALVNIALGVIWIFLALRIIRRYQALGGES